MGTHLARRRRYAWAPRGQRAHGPVPRTESKHTTLVADLTRGGEHAAWTIAGALPPDAGAVRRGSPPGERCP